MKNCFFVTLVFMLVMAGCTTVNKEQTKNKFSSFVIKRGSNIAHWLSQSDRRGEERAAFFTEKDIQFIDSAGFDHIRRQRSLPYE